MRGRRLVIDWQEDERTLWQRYRTEPVPELNWLWHALRAGRRADLADSSDEIGPPGLS